MSSTRSRPTLDDVPEPRRGHRPPAAPHPQRVRERRQRRVGSRSAQRRHACARTSTAAGLDCETYEPAPGAQSLVARIEGTRPDAPTLSLMGHTDVVPVNADRWRHDPFGGELVDGEVWGRGAVDMLNLTVVDGRGRARRWPTRASGREGTLIYLAVADEEALGTWGAHHLVDHELDAVRCRLRHHRVGRHPDPVSPGGSKLPVMVGEKGCYWCHDHRPGHAGPRLAAVRTDNALVKAAEVVRRIAAYRPEAPRSTTSGGGSSRRWTSRRSWHRAAALARTTSCARLEDAARSGMARQFHACTHTTFCAEHRPRRDEDQHDPRHGRPPGRHPHAAGPDARRTSRRMLARGASATSPTTSTFTASAYDAAVGVADRHAAVGRARRGSAGRFYEDSADRADAHRRRHRRPLLPPARRDRLRLRPVQPQPLASRTTRRCSTATTSASTRSRCGLSTELWEAVARDLLG